MILVCGFRHRLREQYISIVRGLFSAQCLCALSNVLERFGRFWLCCSPEIPESNSSSDSRASRNAFREPSIRLIIRAPSNDAIIVLAIRLGSTPRRISRRRIPSSTIPVKQASLPVLRCHRAASSRSRERFHRRRRLRYSSTADSRPAIVEEALPQSAVQTSEAVRADRRRDSRPSRSLYVLTQSVLSA